MRAWHASYGLPVTLRNCSTNCGPCQHAEKFVPTVIGACLERRPIPIYGDGRNVRDWLHVADHCAGVRRILKAGTIGETYHLGGRCEIDNNTIGDRICTIMDELRPWERSHSRLLEFDADRPGHDWRYAMNTQKQDGSSAGSLWCQPMKD